MRGHLASRTNLNFCLHGGVGRGILVCYDQQLVEGFRLIVEEPVLEEGAFSAPGSELLDSLHLVHALVGVPEFAPAREVVASRLVRALHAQGELARLGGRLYVLVKLRMKASVKLTQLLMLRGFKLFNHVRAVPWSISGTYLCCRSLC